MIFKFRKNVFTFWRQPFVYFMAGAAVLLGLYGWIFLVPNFGASPSRADVSDNVSGWAWAVRQNDVAGINVESGIGWISFNCTDRGVCGNSNYGVNINNNWGSASAGNFSGYAWNEEVGWIAFEKALGDPPDNYAFNSNCMGTCNSSNNCIACFNRIPPSGSTRGKVYGWAQILSLGDDGWIKLRDSSWSDDQGVSIDLSTNQMHGWAWHNSPAGGGLGWISFNCADISGVCTNSNYFVQAEVNSPPQITSSSWSNGDPCSQPEGVLYAVLSWTYQDLDGDPQTAYQIQVDDDNNWSNGLLFDTGQCGEAPPGTSIWGSECQGSGGSTQYNLHQATAMSLQYGTTYYWRLKVWDQWGLDSGWSATAQFTIPFHEYPDPYFTYWPKTIHANLPIQFDDQSYYYTDTNPNNPVLCADNPTHCSWSWSVTPATDASISGPTNPNPDITFFDDQKTYDITVSVSDVSRGYTCSTSITIGDTEVRYHTPTKWEETKGKN